MKSLAVTQNTVWCPPGTPPSKKARLAWTGFSGKTVWDWLQFLVQLLGALAIPLVVVVAANALNTQQQQIADTQHQNDLAVADDQQKEATLKVYLDDMASLLLNNNLRGSHSTDEVRNVARIKTLTTLRRLDGVRKGVVIQFLYEAKLIQGTHPAVFLARADLSKANLFGAHLIGTNLIGAHLIGASLFQADLTETNLSEADLTKTNLSEADLTRAQLVGTNLSEADLIGAHLFQADLFGAHLIGASLSEADLSKADLRGVDLTGADLTGARVTPAQLATTRSLKDALMPDGSRHP